MLLMRFFQHAATLSQAEALAEVHAQHSQRARGVRHGVCSGSFP